MKRTTEYQAWQNMKGRCNNPNNKDYGRYGGRGIKVCAEWQNDFEAFLAHIGKKPNPKLELDRINNDGNYEAGNVRWATHLEQSKNRGKRSNNTTGESNVFYFDPTQLKKYKVKKRYSVIFWRNHKAIYLGYYRTISEAVKVRDKWLIENP